MFETEKARVPGGAAKENKTVKSRGSEIMICPICYTEGHGVDGCGKIENLGSDTEKDRVFGKIRELISESGIAKLEEGGLQTILNQADERERQEMIEKIISFYGLGSEWIEKVKYRKNGKSRDNDSGTVALKVMALKDPQLRLLEGNNGKVKIKVNDVPICWDRDAGKYMFRYNLVKDGDKDDPVVRVDQLSTIMHLKKDEEMEINQLRDKADKVFSKRAA